MAQYTHSQKGDRHSMSMIPDTCNVTEVAELLGVKVRWVQQLARDGIIPRARRNAYPLAGVVQGMIRFWQAGAEELGGGESRLDRARRRKLEIEAETKGIELSRLRGEFVPLTEVDGLLREALMAIDSVIRSVPRKYAPSFAKKTGVGEVTAKRFLDTLVEEIRGEIHKRAGEESEPE